MSPFMGFMNIPLLRSVDFYKCGDSINIRPLRGYQLRAINLVRILNGWD